MRAQRKQRLMSFIQFYIDEHGEPPTIREIGACFGWSSPASVHKQLVELENMGLIRRTPNVCRGIEVVK